MESVSALLTPGLAPLLRSVAPEDGPSGPEALAGWIERAVSPTFLRWLKDPP